MTLKSWQWNLALFIAASPVLAIVQAVRAARRLKLLVAAQRVSTACGTCGAEIMLVGFWRCGCGFTYQGHLLRLCPICGSFPEMVRCYRCGATEKLPAWN